MENPKFSWLIPCGPDTKLLELQACLESVKAELREGDQVVLVRDGMLEEVLCQYHRRPDGTWLDSDDRHGSHWPCLADAWPGCVTVDTHGLLDCGKALNAGLQYCSGEWVVRMDADDIVLPGRINCHLTQIRASGGAATATGGGIQHIDRDGKVLFGGRVFRPPYLESKAIQQIFEDGGVPLWHPASCIRMGDLLACGGWPEDMPRCEDYGLWLRLELQGLTVYADPTPVTLYRRRENPRSPEQQERVRKRKQAAKWDWQLERFRLNASPEDLARLAAIQDGTAP